MRCRRLEVTKLTEVKTVNGEMATIRVDHGVVMIDGAKVVEADIQATNGVIHVIDAVILPR